MNNKFESVFNIRYHECDLYEHLNHTNYFYYVQETGIRHLNNLGFNFNKNTLWLVSSTTINYLKPILYNDKIRIISEIASINNFSIDFNLSFHNLKTDLLLSKVSVRWLNKNPRNNSFIKIHFEKKTFNKFILPKIKEDYSELDPKKSFSITKKINNSDVNPESIMNIRAHVSFMEECALEQCISRNWPFQRMVENNIGIIARNYTIEYINPAFLNDEIIITTWIANPKGIRVYRYFTIKDKKSNKILSKAKALWIWVDLKRNKPMQSPDFFYNDFKELIVSKE